MKWACSRRSFRAPPRPRSAARWSSSCASPVLPLIPSARWYSSPPRRRAARRGPWCRASPPRSGRTWRPARGASGASPPRGCSGRAGRTARRPRPGRGAGTSPTRSPGGACRCSTTGTRRRTRLRPACPRQRPARGPAFLARSTSVGPVRLCAGPPVAGGGVEEDVAHALVAVHEPPFRLVGDALDVSGARVVVEVDLRGDHHLRRSDRRGEQEGYVDDVLERGELAPQLLLDSWVDGLADEQGDVGPRQDRGDG